MARFLSEAWFNAIARSANPVDPAEPARLTVQQVVTGTPDGEVRYTVSVGDRRATVQAGSASHVDVTFTEDYPTAVAIARGELTTQAALLAGRIRVTGNLAALARRQDLASDDLVPTAVRTATTY